MRRKSLPATMSPGLTETEATLTPDLSRPTSTKTKAKSSRRQPLDGGTLAHEGKIFKAPNRENGNSNLPLKQAQVCRHLIMGVVFPRSHYAITVNYLVDIDGSAAGGNLAFRRSESDCLS